jgi:hypothetical protein
MTEEFTQRLFGTIDDGILYLSSPVMKAARLKPGDKLRITLDKDGFAVHVDKPRLGGPP